MGLFIFHVMFVLFLVWNICQKRITKTRLAWGLEWRSYVRDVSCRQNSTLEELVQSCLDALLSLTGSMDGCIYLYDYHQRRFTMEIYSDNFPQDFFQKIDILRKEILHNQQFVIKNGLWRDNVISHSLFFPVLEEDAVVAIVGLVNNEREYGIDDLHWASQFVEDIWPMIARKQNGLKLEHLTYYDSLTGLPNRRFLVNQLELFNSERYLPLALIVGDVNDLRIVNDAFGYQAGDELLQKVATTLQRYCGQNDIVGRWAGDQFVFILPNTNQKQAMEFAHRLEQAFLKSRIHEVPISLSFGWDTKITLEQEIEEIIKKAEHHMYQAELDKNPIVNRDMVQALMSALYEKSPREEQHSQRVGQLCLSLGKELGLDELKVAELRVAGLFHDIGKIAIESQVLNKIGRLTSQEWEQIKRHPESGYRILQSITGMENVAEMILCHHERWDGSGYPRGLEGEQIPLASRIIAVADAYDAMVSVRSYRQPLSHEDALEELRRCSGTDFDVNVVEAFIRMIAGA